MRDSGDLIGRSSVRRKPGWRRGGPERQGRSRDRPRFTHRAAACI